MSQGSCLYAQRRSVVSVAECGVPVRLAGLPFGWLGVCLSAVTVLRLGTCQDTAEEHAKYPEWIALASWQRTSSPFTSICPFLLQQDHLGLCQNIVGNWLPCLAQVISLLAG